MSQESGSTARVSPAAAAGRMVVVHFLDGRTLKGTTHDFLPARPSFHLYESGDERSKGIIVNASALKAIFFVRDYQGAKERADAYDFDKAKGFGRKARVTFHDGESISGFTTGYNRDAAGFFLIPADPGGNNTRIFVVHKAVREFQWL